MEEENEKAIKVSTIITISFSLIIGYLFSQFINTLIIGNQLSMSIMELVNLVISILLAGASIVLAITAIQLGKSSEDAIINRNDKSIELQNSIFMKTTEVLTKIKSSTGVTEKRIEDIIAGRASAISEEIFESSGGKSLEDIEEAVINSVRKEIDISNNRIDREKRSEERKKSREKYEKFHEKMLISFSNIEGIKTIKSGHGKFHSTGSDLYDGIYSYNDKLIGISAHSDEIKLDSFKQYVLNIALDIINDDRTDAFLFIYNFEDAILYENKMKEILTAFNEDPSEHIKIIVTSLKSLDNDISNIKL